MKSRILVFIALTLINGLLAGCGSMTAKSEAAANNDATASSTDASQKLPFAGEKKSGSFFGLKPSAPAPVTVPAGTALGITLQNTVSSASAAAGDRFAGIVDEPVVVNGQTVIPKGADVTGKVVAAKSSGHLKSPGYLKLTLASVKVNGQELPVSTSTVFAQAGSHKKRNWAIIGGSTAGGALIGGLVGGGKGALIGSAVGAGGGTGVAYATGKKDVTFPAERHLTFRLTEPVTPKA